MRNRDPSVSQENQLTTGRESNALGGPGQEFLQRVRRSAINVLGNSKTGREVLELCDDHAEARRMILEDRSSGLNVVAVVGATGQGKSWLIRQLVQGSSRNAIRSGNNAKEATESLFWIGPKPPADLDPRFETYVHCKSSDMQAIGVPYLLVDAPGATDDRRSIAAVAARALSLASVLLVVVRRDQLRSEVIASLAEASEGTIVIPVVNAARSRDDRLESDVEAFVARMRSQLPSNWNETKGTPASTRRRAARTFLAWLFVPYRSATFGSSDSRSRAVRSLGLRSRSKPVC